jgi:HNH endonuclease
MRPAECNFCRRDSLTVAELQALPYSWYLRTPHWRATRLKAIRRGGFRCARCCVADALLEVHHKTYVRLGAERDDDLVPLCEDCHEAVHRGQPLVLPRRRKRRKRASAAQRQRPAPALQLCRELEAYGAALNAGLAGRMLRARAKALEKVARRAGRLDIATAVAARVPQRYDQKSASYKPWDQHTIRARKGLSAEGK